VGPRIDLDRVVAKRRYADTRVPFGQSVASNFTSKILSLLDVF